MKKKIIQSILVGILLITLSFFHCCKLPTNVVIEDVTQSGINKQLDLQTSQSNLNKQNSTDTENVEDIDSTESKQPVKNEGTTIHKNKQNSQKPASTEVIEKTIEHSYKSGSTTTDMASETAINEPIENDSETERQSQVYKYCPTCINGNILYCSNENNAGKVKDGIYLNGTQVLSTTVGSWDSAQVCDPTVVAGNFSYNGNNYTYLMAYLGCTTDDCTNNEIGFAVSNDLYNWTKTGKVISCIGDGFWGVGQPSLMNIKNDGIVNLFYTSGTAVKTTTYVECINCNDLNRIAFLGHAEITTSYDFISNADFAYSDGYLYMTCDTHPFSEGPLNFITDKQTIYKAPWDSSFETLGMLDWQIEAYVGIEQTGYSKNHNACFARDGIGNLSSRTAYVSTASEVGDFLDNLFTYNFIRTGF